MRPLRSIERSPALKLVVEAILACVPHMGWISLLAGCVYILFAVVGTNLWAGKHTPHRIIAHEKVFQREILVLQR